METGPTWTGRDGDGAEMDGAEMETWDGRGRLTVEGGTP
jgi:hypothetical protein